MEILYICYPESSLSNYFSGTLSSLYLPDLWNRFISCRNVIRPWYWSGVWVYPVCHRTVCRDQGCGKMWNTLFGQNKRIYISG